VEQNVHFSKYEEVPATSTVTHDYVVADGATLYLFEIGGNARGTNNSNVEVIWDPDGENRVLMATYGDSRVPSEEALLGDGVKKVRIQITNNTAVALAMGGWFAGVEISP
jgi:hypothetical protein